MNYDEWGKSVPLVISGDTPGKMKVYRYENTKYTIRST